MHTVFINTSKNVIGDHIDVLKIEKEFKKLTYISCPLSSWNNKDGGFECCAERIGELIDSHKEINNTYNMIVYVDLLETREYIDLVLSQEDAVLRGSAYEVLISMFTRFILGTLYEKLDVLGRTPSGKLLLLFEQGRRVDVTIGNIIDPASGKLHTDHEIKKLDVTLSLLGLPAKERIIELGERARKGENIEETLKAEFAKDSEYLKILDPRSLYEKNIKNLYDSIIGREGSCETSCYELLHAVESMLTADRNSKAVISEFYTDRRSNNTNKEMNTKRNLAVQIFLLECINDECLYAVDGGNDVPKTVPVLTSEQWKQIACVLAKKKKTYEWEESEVVRLGDNYTSLGLAPRLYKLPNEKFGLDESGNISADYKIRKVADPKKDKKDKKEKKKKKQDGDNAATGPIPITKKDNELVIENGRVINWFTSDEFELFDAEGTEYTDDASGILSADEYCERAEGLATHHLNFLGKLNLHINQAMSNYSGRSLANIPAILRKRSTCVDEESDETVKNDYKYTAGHKTEETKPPRSILKTSKKSYETLISEYLKFNAGRGVAMTDIKDQCEWFINRIRQIEESLKKLFSMLFILAVTLLFLYVPFVLIQWEAITKNIDTLLVAAISLAVPFVLLGIAYTIARILQRRKMKKAWETLVEKSNEAIGSNKKSVMAYDELLTMYIPALRWIYEYSLDVDFYYDCCRTADAKREHHRSKLAERQETIGNILEDLECDECKNAGVADDYDVDYTKAFCEGRNREFYSIIDEEILKIIKNGK